MTKLNDSTKNSLVQIFNKYGLQSPVYVFGDANSERKAFTMATSWSKTRDGVYAGMDMIQEIEQFFGEREVRVTDLTALENNKNDSLYKQLYQEVYSGEKIYG